MLEELKELWRFRELLRSMVERELKIRYKNSFLGFLWSLINPLVTVLVMTVVFKYLMDNPTPNLSAYILAAYLPFMFFQFVLLDSAQSVLTALPVVRKVYFPREILPLAAILSNIVHFLLALGIFFLYLLVIWIRHPNVSPFTWNVLLVLPLILINVALATGLGLLVAALNTFYEDVKYLVSVGLYLLFFLCPIMYFSENVFYSKALAGPSGQVVYVIYHLNPMAMLATAYKKVLVPSGDVYVNGQFQPPLSFDWPLFALTVLTSLLTLVGGYAAFNRMKWRFVERP